MKDERIRQVSRINNSSRGNNKRGYFISYVRSQLQQIQPSVGNDQPGLAINNGWASNIRSRAKAPLKTKSR